MLKVTYTDLWTATIENPITKQSVVPRDDVPGLIKALEQSEEIDSPVPVAFTVLNGNYEQV